MKKILIIICAFCLISDIASAMSPQERIDDAHTIINIYTQQYGPLQWKIENLGLDFNASANELLGAAANAPSDREFYRAVALFLAELRDAHVSYNIPSSLVAFLPFRIEYFKDGVVVKGKRVEKSLCGKKEFKECAEDIPIHEGDILMAIDGVPVEDIIDELIPYNETGHEPTNRKTTGSYFVTYRPQAVFPDVPEGKAVVTVRRDGENFDVETEWIRTGFELAEMPPKSAISYMTAAIGASPYKASTSAINAWSPDSGNSFIEDFRNSHHVNFALDKGNAMIGNPFPFFPLWDDFEQRMKKYYYTGTFNVGENKIGYIRIESWMNYSKGPHIDALEKEIAWMNNNTDAIIIDQTNNGGGNSCYMNKVASFFIFEPKNEIKFQLRANRMWLSMMEGWYAYAMDEADKVHALSWLTALRKAVENGDYLSEPLPDCSALGKIFPYRNKEGTPVLYTHPVLVLTNELDFSAADMFPVLMKDIGAAKLFGARTAGAGGSVTGTQMIGNSELSLRVTLSLMFREKETLTEAGTPTHYIENVGATPDFIYETTLKDYQDEYKAYRAAIEGVILGLIGK